MPLNLKAASAAKKPQKRERPSDPHRTSVIIRNPATEVVVKLNQKQSLNIIQTSVAASLSTILFIKDVFPSDYFEQRSYNMNSPDFTYSITPADGHSVKRQGADENTVTWDMLVPGKHKHVDKLLFWLKGIGEAIRLQYLASVVISIHHDYITPNTLAEAYVLNFAYKGDGHQPQMGITVGKDTVDITLQNHQDMKKLFTRLLKLANAQKVDLPEHPAIGMQLTYNETCPEDYQPPGFRAAPPSKWIDEKGATVVGALDSGYHKMHMRMLPPPIRPQKTPLKATRQLNIDSSPSQSELMSTPQREPRKVVQRMVAPKQVAPDTQFFGGSLDGMQAAQSKALPKDLAAHGHPVEQKAEGRIFRFKGAEDPNSLPLQLQPILAQSASMVAVTQGGSSCFCGIESDDAAHCCQKCGLAQHRRCYGLIENDSVRSFFCYDCLLQKKPPLLREMKEICQLRRLLDIIAKEGYPLTESELAKSAGYLVKEAKSASLRLAEEGYLKKVYRPNEKKAKSFRKGPLLSPFEFDKTQEPRLLKEYWNPAYKVDAYVETLTSIQTSALEKQPKAGPPMTMSPTPHSFKPQVQPQPTKEPAMLHLDDDDDEDDDLSVSRRSRGFSSADRTSNRTGSPGAMRQSERKRKAEELQRPARREKIARKSEQNSPFAL